jgi:hypothetical protein
MKFTYIFLMKRLMDVLSIARWSCLYVRCLHYYLLRVHSLLHSLHRKFHFIPYFFCLNAMNVNREISLHYCYYKDGEWDREEKIGFCNIFNGLLVHQTYPQKQQQQQQYQFPEHSARFSSTHSNFILFFSLRFHFIHSL